MHEPHQHVSPITNWKQLVIVVALAFIVPIAVIILLTQYVTDSPVPANENDSAVLNRIKPVGEGSARRPQVRARRKMAPARRRRRPLPSPRQRRLPPLRPLRAGKVGWQEDLRRGVFGLPRRRRCRRTQIRRQGRMGAASEGRHRHAVRQRDQRQGRDARQGRQPLARRCGRESGGRLHGRRRQVETGESGFSRRPRPARAPRRRHPSRRARHRAPRRAATGNPPSRRR